MPRDIPLATYRLQLSKDFGFDAAAALAPYLKALGITHLYASPFLKARAGSTHGYDIVDHAELNPEFGGEAGFERLSRALADADLGLILDFVPNHMGVGEADNAWWLDVLEWGQKSPHARSFDIDWETLPNKPDGGVLLPILGNMYGDALEAGEIALTFDAGEGSFSAWYYDNKLPIRPNRYADILHTIVGAAAAEREPAGQRLLELAAAHRDPGAPSREHAPAMKAALAAVEGGADIIERGLRAFRPVPGDAHSATLLHRLLERQHYRLANWRAAVSEINYRRFFDVNGLAGLRVEDIRTFTAIHRLVIRLIAEGRLHGLRLDHIDGLQNPQQYAERLQRLVRRTLRPARGQRPFYTLVEKILGEGEVMPDLPGIAGTTGYEWLNVISRVLVDGRGTPALEAQARAFTTESAPFETVVLDAKRRVLDSILASEFTVLARLFARIAAGHWRTRDYTADRLREALRLFVLHFPVYRTYVTERGASDADRATIGKAIAAARAGWFGPDDSIFDLLTDALTLDLVAPGRQGYSRARVSRFAFKVQQFTGPMMAKSLEDTAFYRYVPLLALSEVGGDPALPPLSVDAFHAAMQARTAEAPHSLTATATHDTKRGEDARARLLALSEIPEEWQTQTSLWSDHNATLVGTKGGRPAPSRTHEYMIYQSLLGAYPLGGHDGAFVPRMQAYIVKAAREGKRETSWLAPREDYEAELTRFVEAVLDPERSGAFLAAFKPFAERVARLGFINSMAQLVLKACMPGVPDFYQGTERWDLSLVDPDNRRPVDFQALADDLSELGATPDWAALAGGWEDGRIKLAMTRHLLGLRQAFQHVFDAGAYLPLIATGADAERLIAFARVSGSDALIVVIGRHLAGFSEGGRTAPDRWTLDAMLDLSEFESLDDTLRGQGVADTAAVAAADLFGALPVALLRARRRRGAATGRRTSRQTRPA